MKSIVLLVAWLASPSAFADIEGRTLICTDADFKYGLVVGQKDMYRAEPQTPDEELVSEQNKAVGYLVFYFPTKKQFRVDATQSDLLVTYETRRDRKAKTFTLIWTNSTEQTQGEVPCKWLTQEPEDETSSVESH